MNVLHNVEGIHQSEDGSETSIFRAGFNRMEKYPKKNVRRRPDTRWRLHRPLPNRKFVRILSVSILLVFCYQLCLSAISPYLPLAAPREIYLDHGTFEPLSIVGFVNTGDPEKAKCEDLRYEDRIQVQQSFHLDDDLVEVARLLEGHPMIKYPDQYLKLPFDQMVNQTWTKLAQSSVWLQKQEVFLTVTRFLFYDRGVRQWPIISFIRGQVFDENWKEIRGYTFRWRGDIITFPRVFDIPTPYQIGGSFYGPEDPRIIVEDGVDDAEPVVIFNMISVTPEKTRAMYMYRPFSNDCSILSITGQEERAQAEKNWMPFFHRDAGVVIDNGKQRPSRYLHFVHSFEPLKILRCHLLNGWCDIVFEEKIPEKLLQAHNDVHGRMSGGTNLVPLMKQSGLGVQAYVGFPRTHIDAGCRDETVYRPDMMIITASGNHFYLNFMSSSIDFGAAAMSVSARADPCGSGRILIANSIARWDRGSRRDIMTLSFTVDDSTTQVLKLHGVWNFIQGLPHLHDALLHDTTQGGQALWDLRWSAVSNDVLACSVEAAQNYSIAVAAPSNGMDLRKQREEEKE